MSTRTLRRGRRRLLGRLLGMAAIALLAALAAACTIRVNDTRVTASGTALTRTFDLTGFDALDISHAFDVQVTRADSFAVSVTADDNIWDDVVVERNGDTLRIGIRSGVTVLGSFTLEATVSMPELARADLSGASHVQLSGFSSTGALVLSLSGASTITGDVDAGSMDVDASGASNVQITGAADQASLTASGASRLALSGYALKRASVDLSGASVGDVNVSESLDRVDVSGASRLTYTGGASLGSVSTSGASSISER